MRKMFKNGGVQTRNFRPRRAIAQLGFTALIAAALAGCSSHHATFNQALPTLFRGLSGPNPKTAARRLFSTTSPDDRRAAIAYFSRQKYGFQAPYMAAYELLTTDPDALVRGQAILALGRSREHRVGPYLVRALHDKSKIVRLDAAVALQSVVTLAAVSPLIGHLHNDSSADVRANCAMALELYQRPRVVHALIDALDDRNMAVVQFAWESLTNLTGRRFPRDSKPWLRWYRARSKQRRAT